MNRIEAIYNYIDEKDKVVDVGCDQAKLSIMLAKRNQPSIASDISEKVINRAKENIDSPLIDFRVSDGLQGIKECETDTLVLSGMGSHTIINIIKNTTLRFNKIITISNNYHDILRKRMLDFNYIVSKEQIIKEGGKYYNLIIFKEGILDYSDIDIELGINHVDKKMYIEYLNYLLKKYNLIKTSSNGKNEKINYLIEIINKKINYLKK